MADQGLFQGRQQSKALLTQRREIAADAAKAQRASLRVETAGDLLLNLHYYYLHTTMHGQRLLC